MEFRLLGPVEVISASGPASLGGAKPRRLLAALLLEHGRTVPVDRLISVVWGEEPPSTARAVLQTYVATLRRALAVVGLPRVIESDRYGYRAEITDSALDVRVFEQLLEQGQRAARHGAHDEARESLRTALALWRGPALGGIGDSLLRAEANRLDESRLIAIEERVGADLALGQGQQLLAELTELVILHPTRERLRGSLMVALYRAGRQAHALDVYHDGRQLLRDELGIDPGPGLRKVYEAILRCDPALLPSSPSRTPRQLPPSPPDFVGREAETTALRVALVRPDRMPVAVISGAVGTGKSTLAHRVAHEIAEHFPDGQYHVELGGCTASPAAAQEVLGRILRDLGRTVAHVPASLEDRAADYRTLLAGTRTLVLLDDAASEAQVRPLLPGSAGCAVLITSRNRLSGLAGATFTELGVLSPEVASDLLSHIVGLDRVLPEPAAATEIGRLCGHLPLAIRIAGARLASRRQWTLAQLVSRLADERYRLDELEAGDQQVRAGIAFSYTALPELARTALRRLGLLGLPYLSAWVAAASLEISLRQAERVLEQLVDVSLIEVDGVDQLGLMRYRMHDLVELLARERALEEEQPRARVAVVERVLGGWLWLIEHIGDITQSHLLSIRTATRWTRAVAPEVTRLVVANPHCWLRAEEEALTVAVELAASLDLDGLATELAITLSRTVFEGHRRVVDNPFMSWRRTHHAALAAARRNANAAGEAALLAGLGQLHGERHEYARAREYLNQALSMFRTSGDARSEAAALAVLGVAYHEQGCLSEALHFLDRAGRMWVEIGDPVATAHVRRLSGTVRLAMGDYAGSHADLTKALSLYATAGSRRGQGMTLRDLSLHHRARGDYQKAAQLAHEALAMFEPEEDRLLVAYSQRALAKALLRLGDSTTARRLLEDALEVSRVLADPFGEACTLRTLGETHLADGRLYQAKHCFEHALGLWTELHAELFRARTLHNLAQVYDALSETTTARQLSAEAKETFRTHCSREHVELSSTFSSR